MEKTSALLPGFVAVILLLVLVLTLTAKGGKVSQNYLQQREALIAADRLTELGANLSLNAQEKILNNIILKEKRALLDPSINNRTIYSPALSFYKSKPIMEKLSLFKLVQSMPKGGVLHIHDLAITSLDWLVQNATYRDHVYMCFDADGHVILAVFLNPPKNPDCPWQSVKTKRESSGNIGRFDSMLKKNLSFLGTDPVTEFVDNDEAWVRFNKYFTQVSQLIFYIPVFKDYLRQGLWEIYSDNVQYIEYRGGLSKLFDLDRKPKDAEFGLLMVQEVINKFVRDYPDFIGGRVIMTGVRSASQETVMEEVKQAVELRRKYPDFFLGFDLVGDEVWYNPLIYYIDALLYPSKMSPPFNLPYYFHAGETDWQNTAVDYNLVDALLLNTSRIGHGYALSKHPHLANIARSKQIALEVNPISNQVLRLVTDLQNHPITSLMAGDFPIVISSDDPGAWDALPLSHDFFLALTTMSGKNAGLEFLKQLAINSIRYSGMSPKEKNVALQMWQVKWEKFIKDQVILHSSHPLLFHSDAI